MREKERERKTKREKGGMTREGKEVTLSPRASDTRECEREKEGERERKSGAKTTELLEVLRLFFILYDI